MITSAEHTQMIFANLKHIEINSKRRALDSCKVTLKGNPSNILFWVRLKPVLHA